MDGSRRLCWLQTELCCEHHTEVYVVCILTDRHILSLITLYRLINVHVKVFIKLKIVLAGKAVTEADVIVFQVNWFLST